MGDSRVRLDPMRILFHVKNDKLWRSANPRAIAPDLNWIGSGQNLSESMLFDEDESSAITVGCVNRKIKASEMLTKGLWTDIGLEELRIQAEGGKSSESVSTKSIQRNLM